MRLGTYARTPGQDWRAALFRDDGLLLDLAAALEVFGAGGGDVGAARTWRDPADMHSWITPAGRALAATLARAADANQAALRGALVPLASVIHGPPFPRPGKFIAVGRNYMEHVREGQAIWAARGKNIEVPTFPTAFIKVNSAISAQGMPIVIPAGVDCVDYEVELAFVIGTPAYRVDEARALEHVAGYTICNDVGARAIQRREMEGQIGLSLSKNFRSFAPTGPWLVTADEIPDPQKLDIGLTVNGEERQHASTADMMSGVARLIAYWSQLGLEPGDMITTGTPSGVALARPEPEKFYLRAGDVVRARIEGIGTLENPVRAEAG